MPSGPIIFPPSAPVPEVVTVLLTTSILYIFSVWRVLKLSESKAPRVILILAAALAFRLAIFPFDPGFSDDLYRYRWEGRLQSVGGNPYLTAPRDPAALAARDGAYWRVDGKDFRAVYGPAVEIAEHGLYRLAAALTANPARQVFVFKAAAALADLGVIAALLALLRARRLPLERILIYAWCPLPIFEFSGTGHNDVFVVLFIALALAAVARGGQSMAYLWLSLAAAVKIWPLVLFPAFTGWRLRRVLAASAVLAGVGLAVTLPYGASVFSNRGFASGFLGGWRNNDSLFGWILVAARDPYRAKVIAFAFAGLAAAAISLTRWTLERKALATVAAMLAVSANVHPWYATWLLPMLVVDPLPAGLLFVAAVPVFYEPVIGWTVLHEWNGLSDLRWWVYGGVAVTAIARRYWRQDDAK